VAAWEAGKLENPGVRESQTEKYSETVEHPSWYWFCCALTRCPEARRNAMVMLRDSIVKAGDLVSKMVDYARRKVEQEVSKQNSATNAEKRTE